MRNLRNNQPSFAFEADEAAIEQVIDTSVDVVSFLLQP